jgi:hypothetical protein
MLLAQVYAGGGPVALYAEREVKMRTGRALALFKQPAKPVRRATGVGPQPIKPKLPWIPDVGSEGIVATLITEIARANKGLVFSHPGPGLIRKHRIRRFIVVTDFVGSGTRVLRYLDAAWQVWSVRSWWSARATTGLRFAVAAYSATKYGQLAVEAHVSKPSILMVTPCPVIESKLSESIAKQVKEICIECDPIKSDEIASLGFLGTGALIAFAHGAPNNVPRILTEQSCAKRTPKYIPLFLKRTTALSRSTFSAALSSNDKLRSALVELGQRRLASSQVAMELAVPQLRLLLTLSALTRPPRGIIPMAGRTGLTIIEVERALAELRRLQWIDIRHRLTDQGQAQLRHSRRLGRQRPAVPPLNKVYYYPSSLRAPDGKF